MRVWLNDPRTVLIYGGQNLVERHLADQTTLINAENDSITIQTDAETHLPLRRSYQWRDPLYKDKNTDAEEYDDYHMVEGLPTAYTLTRYHNDDMTNQRFLSRAGLRYSVDAQTCLILTRRRLKSRNSQLGCSTICPATMEDENPSAGSGRRVGHTPDHVRFCPTAIPFF